MRKTNYQRFLSNLTAIFDFSSHMLPQQLHTFSFNLLIHFALQVKQQLIFFSIRSRLNSHLTVATKFLSGSAGTVVAGTDDTKARALYYSLSFTSS